VQAKLCIKGQSGCAHIFGFKKENEVTLLERYEEGFLLKQSL
jgi:hypothetical protein